MRASWRMSISTSAVRLTPEHRHFSGVTVMRLFASLTLLVMVTAGQATEMAGPSTAPVPKGPYALDKAHASLIFRISHLGFSTYAGRFTRDDAKLDFAPQRLGNSSVDVTIEPSSITADNLPEGSADLMAGKQFLDAAQFSEMKFVSKSIDVQGRDLRINGELTLHGVTRPIVLEARYNGGYASHPYEPQARVGFSAK